MATKSFIKTIGSKGLLSDYNTAGKKLQTEVIAGDNITIDSDTISSNQVFVATYGTTTYAEVKAAYDAGKICTVLYNGRYYYANRIDSRNILFAASNGNNTAYQVSVGSDNTWANNSFTIQPKLTFDTTPTAGSTNPVTSDGIKTALNDKFDKYGFFGKTDGKWIGAALSVDGETEVKYWKLCSFTTAKFWSLNFVADVTNAHYDSNVFERKIIAIYGSTPGVVSEALEIREGNNKLYSTRGYGNIIYYETSGNNVTIYIKAKFAANASQYCRLVSVLSECSISNLTWYQETTAGTQPENPVKFSLGYKTVKPAGSTSVPVYIGSDGNPTACTDDFVHNGDVTSTYSSTGTAPVNGTAVAAAINALDVSSVGGDGKYISAISETDGKISAAATTMDTTPTANSTKAVTSGGIKTALNNYVTITKGDSSNFHVKNNEYYSFICRTQFSNWEKMQADFFCPSSDSSTIGKFNIFATLSTTDTSLHTPERVAEFGGIVWDYNYKGYNTINYRIYVAKSGDNFYFYAKRNSSNDKSITAFRSCLLYTTNSSLTDNVSADLDDATWQTLSLVEMTHVYTKATQEDLNKHVNNNIVHLTSEEHNLLNTILTPPASGTAVLKSVNGVLQWVTE